MYQYGNIKWNFMNWLKVLLSKTRCKNIHYLSLKKDIIFHQYNAGLYITDGHQTKTFNNLDEIFYLIQRSSPPNITPTAYPCLDLFKTVEIGECNPLNGINLSRGYQSEFVLSSSDSHRGQNHWRSS